MHTKLKTASTCLLSSLTQQKENLPVVIKEDVCIERLNRFLNYNGSVLDFFRVVGRMQCK